MTWTKRSELAAVDRTGHCTQPIRLVTHTDGGDEIVLVACGTRRGRLCPACSDRYKGDAFQLVAAGMRGGKGMPASVASHPMVFLTATAPGFGPVHATRKRGEGACRPRKARPSCPHGTPLWCFETHRDDDPLVGSALCAECFDYEAAVIFNASVSELWHRALIASYRALAGIVGMSERELRGEVRLSYQKVCEFQKRGLVHLDAREPPPSPPPAPFDGAVLARALSAGLRRARLPFPPLPGREGELITYGGASGTAVVELSLSSDEATKLASYLGKYSIKSVADGLERRIGSKREIGKLVLSPHMRRMVETAWTLGGRRELRGFGLRRFAHQLGHGGHVLTKSRYWSTTFEALRTERRDWRTSHMGEDFRERTGEEVWRFAGIGYDKPGTAHLARALADLDRSARTARTARRGSSPDGAAGEVGAAEKSFEPPTWADEA